MTAPSRPPTLRLPAPVAARLPRGGLRARILVLLCVALLPVAAALAWYVELHFQAAEEQVRATVLRYADAIAASYQTRFLETQAALAVAARMPTLRRADLPECRAVLDGIGSQLPWLTDVWVTDPRGVLTCSRREAEGIDRSHRRDFQEALTSDRLAVGETLIGRVSGRAVINVSLRLPLEGSPGFGTIGAGIDIAWLDPASLLSGLPAGSVAVMFDRDAKIVYRSADADRFVGTYLPASGRFRTGESGSTTFVGNSIDGQQRLYGTRRLGLSDMEVRVGVPVDSVRAAPLLRSEITAGMLLLAVALSGLLIHRWVGRHVATPIAEIARAASRIAAREPVVLPVATGRAGSEVDALARAIAAMAKMLAEGEARLLVITDNLPVTVYQTRRRPDGSGYRYTFMSNRVRHMTGLSPDAVYTDPDVILDVVHPDDREAYARRIATPPPLGQTWSSEYRLLRDGEVRWLRSLGIARLAEDGDIIGDGVAIDVTDVKQAVEQLATARTELRDALEGIEHEMTLWDTNERLQLWNGHFTRAARNFGLTAAVGLPFPAFAEAAVRAHFPGATADEQALQVASRLAAFRAADGNPVTRPHPDGTITLLRVRRLADGRTIVTAIDETRLFDAEAQVRELVKVEAIGRLSGGMAHDFNNYLGVILGNLDELRETVTDAGAGDLVEQAMAGAIKAAELTRSLLAFARRQPLAPRVVDLGDRLAALRTLLSRTMREDVAVSVEAPPGTWPVRIDPAQLDSCIVNLASNARDAMPRGGRIAITSRNHVLPEGSGTSLAPGDYVEVAVADTGTGIPGHLLSKIFEPFYTTKGPSHGTGLGLSMVQGFIRQSGGDVLVTSTLGAGTTVRMLVPRHVDPAAPLAGAAPARHAAGDGQRILLVEDNPSVRRTASRLLERAGYRVVEAVDGPEALARLAEPEAGIGLLFTDVVLPGGLSGLDLARDAVGRHPGLKVLVTTGFSAAIEDGIDFELLAKPYRRDEVLDAVERALAPAGERAMTSAVERPGAPAALTPC